MKKKINEDIFYIYKVTNIKPSEPLEFEQVKDKVIEDWKIYYKTDKINEIYTENKSNKLFINEISEEYNLDINILEVSKDNKILPRLLINNVFDSDVSELNMIKVDEDIFFYHIENIIINENDESLSEIYVNLRNGLSLILSKDVKISTNDRLIDVILNSF